MDGDEDADTELVKAIVASELLTTPAIMQTEN